MKLKGRLFFLSLIAVLTLLVNLAFPITAFADDETPPPAPTEEPVSPPTAEPAEETVSPEVEPTVAEVLNELPDGTEIVVINEAGEVEPLATEEAAAIIVSGDPMWCPTGALPGDPTCTASYADLFSLIDDINNSIIAQPAADGTIWIQDGADGSGSAILIDGTTLGTWASHTLTLQGGWNGISGDATVVGASTFGQPISIVNWNANITLNDLIFDGTSNTSIDIETAGNVVLSNVGVYDSGGDGADIDNDGDITVFNSRFWDNDSDGLDADTSGGNLTLTNVFANGNGDAGGELDADGNINVTGGTFNGNEGDGIDADSDDGDISVMNADAQSNDENGLYLTADNGTVSVINGGFNDNGEYGIDIGDDGYADGDITLSNVLAANNDEGGAYLYSGYGSVTITDSQFVDNYLDGYGLYIDADSGITLTRVLSIQNDDGGVQLTTDGNVTVTDSVFNNNDGPGVDLGYTLSDIGGNVSLTNVEANGNSDDGFQAYVDGDLTVNGGLFNSNDGYGINLYESEGTVSLTDVEASGNTSSGAYLDNSAGSGDVTIDPSMFSYNDAYGLEIYSAGNVSLTGVTANGNDGDDGAQIDNDSGTGFVSVANSEFNNNHSFNGLDIESAGAVTLSSVIANFNGSDGAYIDNTSGSADVTISSSRFNVNNADGFYVGTNGDLTLNNVSAGGNGNWGGGVDVGDDINDSGVNSFNNNGNAGDACSGFDGVKVWSLGGANNTDDCEDVDTDVWYLSGGFEQHFDTIAEALTEITNGVFLMDDGILHIDGDNGAIDGALTPYDEDVSIDAGSDADLAQITQLLGDGNNSTLIAGYLEFYNFANGFSVNGLTLSQYVEAENNIGALEFIDVTVADHNSGNPGIWVDNHDGSISLEDVNASDGDDGGAYLNNTASSDFEPITVTDSLFNGNDWGLDVRAYGPVTLTNVDGSFNRFEWGASLDNQYTDADEGQTVNVSNSTFSYTHNGPGLDVFSYGDISLSNVAANGNQDEGAYLETSGDTGNITVLNSTFDYSLDGYGLEVYNHALGNIFVNGIRGNGTSESGAVLSNDWDGGIGSGGVTVLNSNFNYSYDNDGLIVYNGDNGDITLNGVTANANWEDGADLTNGGDTGSITVLNSAFNYSQTQTGLEVDNNAAGNIFVSGVTANGNFEEGAYLENNWDSGIGSGSVTVLNSTFNNGLYFGLGLYNYDDGDIILTNVAANANDGYGADIYNEVAGFDVTVDPSTFNYNGYDGLYISSGGDITLDHVTASFNGQDGADLRAGGEVLIRCGSFQDNLGYGVNADASTLTLNTVYFAGNSSGDYFNTGSVTVFSGADCYPSDNKPAVIGPSLPVNIVPVTSGQSVELDCSLYRGTLLLLPSGDSAYFPCPLQDTASITSVALDTLPGVLPDGDTFASAFTTGLEKDGSPQSKADPFIIVSFVVPDPLKDSNLAILFWDGSKWIEVSGGHKTTDEAGVLHFEAATNLIGTFVLVTR